MRYRGALASAVLLMLTWSISMAQASATVPNLSAGFYHGAMLDDRGEVWVWGNNIFGQLGDEVSETSAGPIPILSNARAISAGPIFNLAVMRDRTVTSWGSNTYGQLGSGPGLPEPDPGPVPERTTAQALPLDEVVAVSSGYWHSLALKSDGTVWAWGRNDRGQLGDGTSNHRDEPQRVRGLEQIAAVSAGAWHNLALSRDGEVYSVGERR